MWGFTIKQMDLFSTMALYISVTSGKTEFSIRNDWPYSDNVADACYPDPCNSHGFCETTNDGLEYTCSCISAYTGATCAEEKPSCNADLCENGGTCFWVYDTEACFCDGGYTGDTCSEFVEEFADPCLQLSCGGSEQGRCVNTDGIGSCECKDGWSGEYCTQAIVYCTGTQYLDLVQQLLLIQPQYQMSCTYLTTQIWAMIPDGETYPALCECLVAMQDYIPDSFNNLECVIDHGLTLSRAVEEYCPMTCTQESIDSMLLTASELDENCHHFIYDRASMPQYRRDMYKCECLLSVASSYEEALEYFPCPFALHTASNGAVAWQHCHDEEVCDFESMYNTIRDVMFQVDAVSAEWCMKSTAKLAGIQPYGPGAYELADYICPCLDGIYKKWPEGIETFNCKPVVFFEVTLKEIMQLVCEDTRFYSPDCTYNLTNSVFELAINDFSGATNCLQAMKLGDQIREPNSNFDEVFCTCYNHLSDLISFDRIAMDECAVSTGWIVPSPQAYCENYLGKTFNDDNAVAKIEADATSDSSDDDMWMILSLIFAFLLAGVVAYDIWLVCSTKSKGYERKIEAES